MALPCNSNRGLGGQSRQQKGGQKCPSTYPFFWEREKVDRVYGVGRWVGMEKWRGLFSATTNCFALCVGVSFLQGYFNCIISLMVMGRWDRKGEDEKSMWSRSCCKQKGMLESCLLSVCSCFYSGDAEPKICLSQEHIKTLVHCNLE